MLHAVCYPAGFLGVTEEFLRAAITDYKSQYGLFVTSNEHIIYFEPLGVMKIFQGKETNY
jgi:hypothetical protein